MMLKVLFVQGGLPAYFKFILNRMNGIPGLEIMEIIPSGKGSTLGAGVKEDGANVSFKIYRLEEYKAWYGKSFFKNFEATVLEADPAIIVLGWPYMMHFAFNPVLYFRMKSKGIKIIHRDIPFNTPVFGKTIQYYRQNLNRQENMEGEPGSFTGLMAFMALTLIRSIYFRMADAHLYYTDESREIIGSYGIAQNTIFVSANSPDTDMLLGVNEKIQLEPRLLPINQFRLIHIGRIHIGRLVKWKRVDLILTAMSQLKSDFPSIELLIAGFGPDEDALKDQVKSLGLEKAVKFLGGIYEPDLLGRYLNESAIYILAGMGGLSINDAMCFAKPVICSEADGTEKRLVREGFNGYYFKNGDATELAKKIRILFSDPEKIKLFGFRSHEIIKNEINIHTVIDQYISAFNFATNNAYLLTVPESKN